MTFGPKNWVYREPAEIPESEEARVIRELRGALSSTIGLLDQEQRLSQSLLAEREKRENLAFRIGSASSVVMFVLALIDWLVPGAPKEAYHLLWVAAGVYLTAFILRK